MGQRTPAVVGLYLQEAGQWRRIAEFRLTPTGHATFRAVDPVEGLVARVWFHQGVDLPGADRPVMPEDGADFLRALLQPFGFRDYRFRDDSPGLRRAGRNGHETVRHAREQSGSAEAAKDSDCAGCAGDESGHCAHGSRHAARPAAWRALDSDVIRF